MSSCEATNSTLKVLSWNVNGLRPTAQKYGGLSTLLDLLDSDIVCFQEHKLRKPELDLAIADGWESFFACTRGSQGYSGVATFCKQSTAMPVSAEEGLCGILALQPAERGRALKDSLWAGSSYTVDDLMAIDREGRVVITDHGSFVLFNIYGVAISGEDVNNERRTLKMALFKTLEARVMAYLQQGRRVLVVGDLNVSPRPLDTCMEVADVGEWMSSRPRQWLYRLSHDGPLGGGPLVDTFRMFHPNRASAFTCWSTATGARIHNYGTRLDLLLAAGPSTLGRGGPAPLPATSTASGAAAAAGSSQGAAAPAPVHPSCPPAATLELADPATGAWPPRSNDGLPDVAVPFPLPGAAGTATSSSQPCCVSSRDRPAAPTLHPTHPHTSTPAGFDAKLLDVTGDSSMGAGRGLGTSRPAGQQQQLLLQEGGVGGSGVRGEVQRRGSGCAGMGREQGGLCTEGVSGPPGARGRAGDGQAPRKEVGADEEGWVGDASVPRVEAGPPVARGQAALEAVSQWVTGADIWPELQGSDHCPAFATLLLPTLPCGPPLATRPQPCLSQCSQQQQQQQQQPPALSSRYLFAGGKQRRLDTWLARPMQSQQAELVLQEPPPLGAPSASASAAALHVGGLVVADECSNSGFGSSQQPGNHAGVRPRMEVLAGSLAAPQLLAGTGAGKGQQVSAGGSGAAGGRGKGSGTPKKAKVGQQQQTGQRTLLAFLNKQQSSARQQAQQQQLAELQPQQQQQPLLQEELLLGPFDEPSQLCANTQHQFRQQGQQHHQHQQRQEQQQQAAQSWSKIMSRMQAPNCTLHNEPAVIRQVKKKGPNQGKSFYVCARPAGPLPQGRCDFFQWARSTRGISMAGGRPSGSNAHASDSGSRGAPAVSEGRPSGNAAYASGGGSKNGSATGAISGSCGVAGGSASEGAEPKRQRLE